MTVSGEAEFVAFMAHVERAVGGDASVLSAIPDLAEAALLPARADPDLRRRRWERVCDALDRVMIAYAEPEVRP